MEAVVEIPAGVEVEMEGGRVTVRGAKGEVTRKLTPLLDVRQDGGRIELKSLGGRKKSTSLVGTWEAHFRNMFNGVTSGWEAKVKVVYAHFPVKLSVEGSNVVIGNFLGERGMRKAQIVGGSAVKLEKDGLTITGADKDAVGQTAANIELASRVKRRDRRVFQDGCYIVQKPALAGAQK